jgi:hypothetical protein
MLDILEKQVGISLPLHSVVGSLAGSSQEEVVGGIQISGKGWVKRPLWVFVFQICELVSQITIFLLSRRRGKRDVLITVFKYAKNFSEEDMLQYLPWV